MIIATTEEIEALELIAVELGISHAVSVCRLLARDDDGLCLHHDQLHVIHASLSGRRHDSALAHLARR